MGALVARVVVLASLLAACSGASGGEARTAPTEESERREVDDAPSPAAGEPEASPREPDPATSCGLALACCRAYASAMPDVVEASACAGVFEALDEPNPDRRCRAMSSGWRRALEHLEGEPPPACR